MIKGSIWLQRCSSGLLRASYLFNTLCACALLNVSLLVAWRTPPKVVDTVCLTFIKVIAGSLDFDTMAGIALTRCASRTLLSGCAAKTARIRGTSRCYGTYFRRTAATAAAVTVNNKNDNNNNRLFRLLAPFTDARSGSCGCSLIKRSHT